MPFAERLPPGLRKDLNIPGASLYVNHECALQCIRRRYGRATRGGSTKHPKVRRRESLDIVKLNGVTKIYPLGKVPVEAIKGIDLCIEKGDFISIAGPSGSGKTTILNMIGCIDKPSEGSVEIGGRCTAQMNDRELTSLRHEVLGFIFQSFNLIPVLDVYENIEFPLLLGRDRSGRKEKQEWIRYLMEETGLSGQRRQRPNELSGGQRQRVAIARALATKPQIVLADEPTANLDSKTGEGIIELMKKLNREQSTTFIFSTHDPAIVSIADHEIHLHDGRVVRERRS
jgi:putative ABC transport system ATP-binding protein